MKQPIVIKFGTGVLTTDASGLQLSKPQFDRIASEVAAIVTTDTPVIIISSAAIAAGVAALGLDERPSYLPAKQACAAVGQSQLMRAYEESFASHNLLVAQLLLTHGDIDSRRRRANAKNTLRELLARKIVVPIINENDSVAVEEIGFGDNDHLGAEVAVLCAASHYLILTRSDGLRAHGERVPVVTDFAEAHRHVTGDRGLHGTGGMDSKLNAVEFAKNAGIDTWILDGYQPSQIAGALAGKDIGTRFPIHSS